MNLIKIIRNFFVEGAFDHEWKQVNENTVAITEHINKVTGEIENEMNIMQADLDNLAKHMATMAKEMKVIQDRLDPPNMRAESNE